MSPRIELVLTSLTPVSLIGMVATSGEPVLKPLRGTQIEPILLAMGWSNTIVFNLCVGYLVSLFFWFLVVFSPEKQRRSLLKRHLRGRYQAFKEEVVQTVVVK